jgi:DNA-binding transcriptional LysR family regulator
MELRALETFSALAKQGTLGRTAALLKLSPAAVSIQLKKLEGEIGISLFDHYPHKLVLTDRGQTFLNEIQQAFAVLNHAVEVASGKVDPNPTRFSISLTNDMSRSFIPCMRTLFNRRPNLRLTMLLRSSPETLSLVQSREVDFGIGRFSNLPPTIQKIKLFNDTISLIYPSNKPPSWIKRIRLHKLVSHRLCLRTRDAGTRKLIDATFLRKNITLGDIIEVSSCQAAMEFVRLGLGIGLVHRSCASATRDKALGYADLSRFFGTTEVSLIYTSQLHLTPTHRTVIDTLLRSKKSLETL